MSFQIKAIPGAVKYNVYSGTPRTCRLIWHSRWERLKERLATRRELYGETPLEWTSVIGVKSYTVICIEPRTYRITTDAGVVQVRQTECKVTVQTKRWWERWGE